MRSKVSDIFFFSREYRSNCGVSLYPEKSTVGKTVGNDVGFLVTPGPEGFDVVGYLDGVAVGTLVGRLEVGLAVG